MKVYLLTGLLSLSFFASSQGITTMDTAEKVMAPTVRNKAGKVIRVYAYFPQGLDSLDQFIRNHMIYPENAWNSNIQGTVTCQFIINRDGHISDVNILKGVSLDIDSEAVRLINSLPRFVPTMFNNTPQVTTSVLHISFTKPVVCRDPDQMPEFPGGEKELMLYMKKMPYPKATGTIIGKLVFTIEIAKDGSVLYATTDKTFGVEYQKEVRRFFRSFPKFTPAYKGGDPTCTELSIPLNITYRSH